jgi:hypothetical protein
VGTSHDHQSARGQEVATSTQVVATPAPASPVPLPPDTLVVGPAEDAAEADADRMAEAALRRLATAGGTSAGAVVGHEGGALDSTTTAAIESKRSGGRPLDAPVLQRMQAAFSTDLSGVRIHDDADSARLNRLVSARAFTTGRDVFFGAGEYAPSTPAGERVLAHELAHTLQPGNDLAHRSPIRRVLLELNNGVYTRASPSTSTPTETATLSRSQRGAVHQALSKQAKGGDGDAAALLREIQAEWDNQRHATRDEIGGDFSFLDHQAEFEREVAELEAAHKKLRPKQKLAEKDKNAATDLIGRIKLALTAAQEDPDTAEVGLQVLKPFLKRLSVVAGDPAVASFGMRANLSMDVSAKDIADYRADTQDMGTWGGLGEAQAIAANLRTSFDIWVVADGKFHLAHPGIGVGMRSTRVLLHLGDHYVVLNANAVVEGADMPDRLPVVAKTEVKGDCLYEGIYILANGRKPDDYDTEIKRLRQTAAIGMTDDMVATSVLLIRSGSQAGLGTRMGLKLEQDELEGLHKRLKSAYPDKYVKYDKELDPLFKDANKQATSETGSKEQAGILLERVRTRLDDAVAELEPEQDEEKNPTSVPKTLYRWVSTADCSDALKNGIEFLPDGGGIPTSTKGSKAVAVTSGAVQLNACLRIDTSKIPKFKFEYVPTRSKLKEVKIKCRVPAEAIKKGP